ncbi:MAG TPA: PP2C family protein-serine/threonine phosphatase [Ignavibacteria bacterium]|nr:PP2C family protein-serine/threonine phosphatase [Ignavibacteria bacterium]
MNLFDSIDQYLSYPREQAYNLFLDKKNLKTFKFVLNIFILVNFTAFAVNLGSNLSLNLSLILSLINLTVVVSARIVYNKYFNTGNIRRSIFIFLIFQLIMLISVSIFFPGDKDEEIETKSKTKNEQSVKPENKVNSDGLTINMDTSGNKSVFQYFFMFSILVLIFRFSRQEILQLFVIGLAITLIIMFAVRAEFTPDNVIPNLILGLMMFAITFPAEKKRQKKFYEQYDFQYGKNYENLRMKKELDYAREIQLSMLPKNEATIGDIEIAAISLPASEVGGDYFDYFKVTENEIGIFICDVSGHGVASGLLLSGLRSCMHLILEDNTNPGIVIEKLNRMIRKTQSRKMFVTAIFAIIDLEKNKCMLYNAGHLPPYKISGESKEIFKIKKHGIALGAMSTEGPLGNENEVTFDFNKNDKIIFYTDGVNEAMDDKKEEYGLDNLEFYLNNNADKKASELLNGLISDVKKFTGNSYQRDDLTLLIIQRN